jgi:hypothetical protein
MLRILQQKKQSTEDITGRGKERIASTIIDRYAKDVLSMVYSF